MKPWHLWIIGFAALLWNAMGCFDYVMTQTQNEDYLAAFSDEQRAYFQSFPAWVEASWAIAVWSGLLGALLLLFASSTAAVVFGISFVAMVITYLHNFALAEVKMHEMTGTEAIWFSSAIFVVALLLWIYALAMKKRGVLR